MKTTLLKNILTMCVLVFSVGAINAQVITWTGATDTDFGTATNWDLGTIPTDTNDLFIGASANDPVMTASLSSLGNANDYVAHLVLDPDAQLTVSAKLWVYANGGTYGANNYSGGNLILETGADINYRRSFYLGVNNSPGTITVNDGVLNVRDYFIIGERGAATLNINGGVVSTDQGSNGKAIIIGNYYAPGIVNLNGGVLKTAPTLSGTAALTIAENGKGDPNATGYLMIDNGTLELTGNQKAFVEGYVAAGKIIAAPGKEIVITYDASTSDVTYVTAVTITPKNVLYVNQTGVGQGAGASAPGADPVIKMLQADPNFNVTYVEVKSDGTDFPDLTGYDLIIAQENISSGAALFKPALPNGKLGLKNVTVPIIYNKSYAFTNTKAVTDADASVPAGQTEVAVTVDPANQTNPMFRGISFAGGNTIPIFASATAKDDGSTGGTKAIDAVINLDITAGGGSLATTSITTDPATSMVINYLPAGTILGTEPTDKLGVDAVALSFSYGATILGDGANISSEALTIWRNAAYILRGGLPVPNSLYVNPDYVTLGLDKNASIVSTNVNAIGNKIYVSNVKSTSEINIYSITGALVKSFKTNEDTNFSFKSGLWIATVKTLEGQKSIKLLMK